VVCGLWCLYLSDILLLFSSVASYFCMQNTYALAIFDLSTSRAKITLGTYGVRTLLPPHCLVPRVWRLA
jgi:hypothetical protein